MTEPNIVYIGDEVRRFTHQLDPTADHVPSNEQLWVAGGDSGWIVTSNGGSGECNEFCTPDGRPVDGFGGAKIEVAGAGTNRWTLLLRGVTMGINQHTIDHAVALGLNIAIQLYGEWVREPTEADLKRRGLL